MNLKTRKMMMMHKTLHPKDDVDRLYGKKEGGREIASNKRCVYVVIQEFKNVETSAKKK